MSSALDKDLIMHNGETSLVYACDRNVTSSFVQEVSDYGADPNMKNADGRTALHAACCRNQPEVVKILLFNSANPNFPGTELPILAALRCPACLELLIPSAQMYTHRMILWSSQRTIIRLTLSYRCWMLAMTRLSTVISMESVKLLLDAGIEPNGMH
jgi:ankyrin repeat protein